MNFDYLIEDPEDIIRVLIALARLSVGFQAEGAIPNKTKVIKINTVATDNNVPEGTKGVILGSFDMPDNLKKLVKINYGYAIEFEGRGLTLIFEHKIKRLESQDSDYEF